MVIHSSLSGACLNCGSSLLLLLALFSFFPSCTIFLRFGRRTPVLHVRHGRPSCICCHSPRTIVLSLSIQLHLSLSPVPPLLISAFGSAAAAPQPLASFWRVLGLTHYVKSYCPWGSHQQSMESLLSPVSVLALTDGCVSPFWLSWDQWPMFSGAE